MPSEAVEVLQRLIRMRTVNPPGDERPALDYLERYLRDAGLETTIVGEQAARPNLVARLRGEAEGPVLGYLGHVDTVLADPGEWRHDPWSGHLDDEHFLWGRGALDMKGQVAAEAVAVATLARSGWRPPRGDVLVMAVSDEETGGHLGAQYLCREHPELVRCDFLVNEGGGAAFEHAGRRRYGVCLAEKGTFRFTLTAHGVAGHASIPAMGDNALVKLAPVLERLARRRARPAMTDAGRAVLAGLGLDVADPAAALARVQAEDPRLAALLEPVVAVTLVPTKAAASEKINVIPSRATLGVDCRVPPGLGEDAAREAIADVLGPGHGLDVAFHEHVEGNASPADSPLMEAIRGWLAGADPDGEPVPVVLPGFTDSKWFRDAFPDCVAYGFFPQRHQTLHDGAPLIHSADERIDVRDLDLATACYADLPRRLLT